MTNFTSPDSNPTLSHSNRGRFLSGAVVFGTSVAMLACGSDDTMVIDDVPDRLTYISQLTIPAISGNTPACCFDFGERSRNGVGIDDNAFAALADSLSGLGVDFQAYLDESLETGDQVLLFNHVGLASETDTFRLDGLSGAFAGSTTYAEASGGTGTFTISPNSFDGNGDALISIVGDLASSTLAAGPDDFLLSVPLSSVVITLNVRETRLTGDAVLSEEAVSYSNGALSGLLVIDEIFDALNGFAASECSCLGLSGDLFTKTGDEWAGNCVPSAATACSSAPNCAQLGGDDLGVSEVCPLLPTILQNAADIDTNDTPGSYEAMSVGFQWSGTNATLAP